MAAGLLLEQFVKVKEGFKFGVLLMGTSPPLSTGLSDDERATKIGIPSTIIVGKDDPWKEEGKKLYGEYWDKEKAKFLELDVGHRLPNLDADTKVITDEILRLYRETKK